MIDVRISGSCVHLSREEGLQLGILLGDRAPFVRNQLMVIRHGGGGAVTLSTPAAAQVPLYGREFLTLLAAAARLSVCLDRQRMQSSTDGHAVGRSQTSRALPARRAVMISPSAATRVRRVLSKASASSSPFPTNSIARSLP